MDKEIMLKSWLKNKGEARFQLELRWKLLKARFRPVYAKGINTFKGINQ